MPVSLKALVGEAQVVPTTCHAFLCIKTGELVVINEDEARAADDPDHHPEDHPEWFTDAVELARDVLGCDDFVEVPFAHLDRFGLMRGFCDQLPDERHRDAMLAAIRGRGAHRRFRDALEAHDLDDAWYAFREAAVARELRDWLDSRGIAYEDDL
jgi:hypothetical protein